MGARVIDRKPVCVVPHHGHATVVVEMTEEVARDLAAYLGAGEYPLLGVYLVTAADELARGDRRRLNRG